MSATEEKFNTSSSSVVQVCAQRPDGFSTPQIRSPTMPMESSGNRNCGLSKPPAGLRQNVKTNLQHAERKNEFKPCRNNRPRKRIYVLPTCPTTVRENVKTNSQQAKRKNEFYPCRNNRPGKIIYVSSTCPIALRENVKTNSQQAKRKNEFYPCKNSSSRKRICVLPTGPVNLRQNVFTFSRPINRKYDFLRARFDPPLLQLLGGSPEALFRFHEVLSPPRVSRLATGIPISLALEGTV
jgi:Zn-finger protein